LKILIKQSINSSAENLSSFTFAEPQKKKCLLTSTLGNCLQLCFVFRKVFICALFYCLKHSKIIFIWFQTFLVARHMHVSVVVGVIIVVIVVVVGVVVVVVVVVV